MAVLRDLFSKITEKWLEAVLFSFRSNPVESFQQAISNAKTSSSQSARSVTIQNYLSERGRSAGRNTSQSASDSKSSNSSVQGNQQSMAKDVGQLAAQVSLAALPGVQIASLVTSTNVQSDSNSTSSS